MEYTKFEQVLLEWFATSEVSEKLKWRIAQAYPKERVITKCGFFLTLDAKGEALSREERREANPLPGPNIQCLQLPQGVEGVLYVTSDWKPSCLEVFTLGDLWPQEEFVFEFVAK